MNQTSYFFQTLTCFILTFSAGLGRVRRQTGFNNGLGLQGGSGLGLGTGLGLQGGSGLGLGTGLGLQGGSGLGLGTGLGLQGSGLGGGVKTWRFWKLHYNED